LILLYKLNINFAVVLKKGKEKEEKMKKSFLGIALAVLMTFVVAGCGRAWADEATPAPKPTGSTLEDIKNLLGLRIYLQGGYMYNLANPDSQENGLRVFDHKANSFTLDLAQIVFNKDASVGGVGYRLKLSAGETAKFIHATGLGNTDDPFDLTEAYVDYIAPVGKGLKFRFGKFVTMHGAEVIEAKDNMNYSRGLLFNFAIPFTHTGLMIGYPFSDKVSAIFYVVNGWDNFNDEGSSKTLCLSVNVTPVEQFSVMLNLMNGRENDLQTNIESNRFLSDTIITVKPVNKFTLVVNTDYAVQCGSAPDGRDAKWYGVANYVKYDFSDLFSAAVRYEYFDDSDGARTGTAQKVKEITLTLEFRVAKNLIVRPEYRHDWSDKKIFDSHHNTLVKRSQDTLALGVMYTW
jgi:hypothetical protein